MIRNLVDFITRVWRRIPSAIRAGWVTAWVTFVGALLTILTGLLPTLAELISTGNFASFYDALSLGLATAVSAATGFLVGVVNTIYRWLHPIAVAYSGDIDQNPEQVTAPGRL